MLSNNDSQMSMEIIDEKLEAFFEFHAGNEKEQRVSFRELLSGWDWAKRSDVLTHYLHRYPAKLLPYIPIFFLSSSLAQKDEIVLDSFAGSGTVGLESISHPFLPRNAYLADISPLARLISSAKTTPISPDILRDEISLLLESLKRTKSSAAPEFPGIEYWFRGKAVRDLAGIKEAIKQHDSDYKIRDFFWVCFSSIVRDMSRADPKIGPPVRLSARGFSKLAKPEVDKALRRKGTFEAIPLFRNALVTNTKRMESLWTTVQASGSPKSSKIVAADSRQLLLGDYLGKGQLHQDMSKKLPDNSVGIIITSPPYINAQKYARTTKLELWWLDLIEETQESFIQFDKAIIGTEKIDLADYRELQIVGNSTCDSLLEEIFTRDAKRAGIIGSYFMDMRKSLKEMYRVLKPGRFCVIVIGNNVVFGKAFPNNLILSEIAQEVGFTLKAMLVDEIRSRGMITKRHETAGMISDEWILVLAKPQK